MSVKDTKEEALPIDSVRRAKVALIEDWGPVTNTIQHNTRYTIDALQCHNIGWRNSARSGHDEQLVPLLLALHVTRAPTTFHYSYGLESREPPSTILR